MTTAVSGNRKAAGHQVRRRDHPQRAGGEEGARGLPHAPAHQLADLPRVVVDAVEDLADGLLGELGQRLRHGRVEQVGAQLPLGAVADRGPDGLGDRVDDRAAHDAQRQQGQERARSGRRRGVRRPSSRGTRRPRRAATSRSRGRSADGGPGASRQAPDPAAVRRSRTWSPVPGGSASRSPSQSPGRYVAGPTSRARFSCDPGRCAGLCDVRRRPAHRGGRGVGQRLLSRFETTGAPGRRLAGCRSLDLFGPRGAVASLRATGLRPRTGRPRGAS